MTKLLDKAVRQAQELPEEQQDAIASIILDEIEEQADIAAYDKAIAEGGDPVPFEQVVRDIERQWTKPPAETST